MMIQFNSKFVCIEPKQKTSHGTYIVGLKPYRIMWKWAI